MVGAGCFQVVVLAHLCEALGLFPSMAAGLAGEGGRYLYLACAVLGLTLVPVGYLGAGRTR